MRVIACDRCRKDILNLTQVTKIQMSLGTTNGSIIREQLDYEVCSNCASFIMRELVTRLSERR